MYTYSITGNVKKNVVEVLSHPEDVSISAASSLSPLTGDKSHLTIIMQNVSLFKKFRWNVIIGILLIDHAYLLL